MGKDWRSKRGDRREQRENKRRKIIRWLKAEYNDSDEWMERNVPRLIDNPKRCRCTGCRGGRKGHNRCVERHEPLEEKDNDTNE